MNLTTFLLKLIEKYGNHRSTRFQHLCIEHEFCGTGICMRYAKSTGKFLYH